MTEQELRAWSLAIAALLQKESKPLEFSSELIKTAVNIGNYIKTGELPPEKDRSALYEW